jgi:hypothetical protein
MALFQGININWKLRDAVSEGIVPIYVLMQHAEIIFG